MTFRLMGGPHTSLWWRRLIIQMLASMIADVTGAHSGSPGRSSLFPSQICMSVILIYRYSVKVIDERSVRIKSPNCIQICTVKKYYLELNSCKTKKIHREIQKFKWKRKNTLRNSGLDFQHTLTYTWFFMILMIWDNNAQQRSWTVWYYTKEKIRW